MLWILKKTRYKVSFRNKIEMAKIVESEDPELIFFHKHSKITTISRAIIYENNLKTSRKDLPRLKIQRRNHNKMVERAEMQ